MFSMFYCENVDATLAVAAGVPTEPQCFFKHCTFMASMEKKNYYL